MAIVHNPFKNGRYGSIQASARLGILCRALSRLLFAPGSYLGLRLAFGPAQGLGGQIAVGAVGGALGGQVGFLHSLQDIPSLSLGIGAPLLRLSFRPLYLR
jgi:hypothetical protein